MALWSKTTMYLYEVASWVGEENLKKWFEDYELEDYLFPDQIQVIKDSGFFSKESLSSLIYNYYLMRQIGVETPKLFEIRTKSLMKIIMRKYLPLIYTMCIDYDLLVNVDFTETFDRNIDAESENSGKTDSKSTGLSTAHNIYNDTPEGNISIQKLEDGDYATSVSTSNTDSSADGTTTAENIGKAKNLEHYVRHQKGNSGTLTTAQALIKQYRDNIISIEQEILDDLNELFLFLY